MNDIEKKAEMKLESWHEEMEAQARKHRDESVFVSHLGPEADADVLIKNLRFMSYCAGYQAARLAERRELLEWIYNRLSELGHGNFNVHEQVLNELKAKLEAK